MYFTGDFLNQSIQTKIMALIVNLSHLKAIHNNTMHTVPNNLTLIQTSDQIISMD